MLQKYVTCCKTGLNRFSQWWNYCCECSAEPSAS